MPNHAVIEVNQVGKCYPIFAKPRDRLKQMMLGSLNRILGLPQVKYYKEFWAVKDVSFQVNESDCIGILGRNGSGKSTLLQLICGTLNPTTGGVATTGRIAALLELGSGFNPEFTGRENIYLNGHLLGLSQEEIDDKINDIIHFADIGQFINQPVKVYSSGMVVRLAFSVSSFVEPAIMIVDEALAVGDAVFQAKCFKRFRQLREQGTTVVLVTHDTASVIQLCSKAILLHAGKLVDVGKPKDIADEYRRRCSEHSMAPAANLRGKSPNTKFGNEVISEKLLWSVKSELMQEHGDMRATIENFAIINEKGQVTNDLLSSEQVVIRVSVRFNTRCEAPIVAFGVRDLKGVELCGSNTWYEQSGIGTMEKDHSLVVDFKFKMPFRAGAYTLSVACTQLSDHGLDVLHRMMDVAVLQIHNTGRFVGIFDVSPEVFMTRNNPSDGMANKLS